MPLGEIVVSANVSEYMHDYIGVRVPRWSPVGELDTNKMRDMMLSVVKSQLKNVSYTWRQAGNDEIFLVADGERNS